MENNRIEYEIEKKFINKNRQERILWEFKNPKKRERVIWGFSGIQLFRSDCLKPMEYMSEEEMLNYLLRFCDTDITYFIGESYIGKLSLKEAVQKAGMGEICIIYCGNGIAYYQGEQENGGPPRYLLIQK